MLTPLAFMLQDLRDRYADIVVAPAFRRLYDDSDPNSSMLAHFHQLLNGHFDFMNQKSRVNHHFNAEDSRQLIALIEEIRDAQQVLERAGVGFAVVDSYRLALQECSTF